MIFCNIFVLFVYPDIAELGGPLPTNLELDIQSNAAAYKLTFSLKSQNFESDFKVSSYYECTLPSLHNIEILTSNIDE